MSGAAPAVLGAPVHASAYEIDLRFEPAESRVEASSVIALRENGSASDTAAFWLHGELRVSEITAGETALEFSQEQRYYRMDYALIGTRVTVRFPDGKVPDNIRVKWSGYFHPSRARSPSDYMRVDDSGVFLRSLGYSPWFPLFLGDGEDEYDVEFRRVSITVPSDWTAVFAGDLESSERREDESRFTWRTGPMSLFAGQLTARPFVVTRAGTVSVYSLADEESLSAAREILELTRSLLDYYRSHYRRDAVAGPIHVVEMPKYGDISSGNVVGIQEERWRSFSESEGSRRTLAHELVHPFVHPKISASDPLYAFVIESFPSYFHYAALDALGQMDYEGRMKHIRERYLEKKRTGKGWRGRPLPEEKPISTIAADEIGTYKDKFILSDRAILFLHELRTRVGKQTFDTFCARLFSVEQLDDSTFRSLVLEALPDFGPEMTTWLDGVDLPAGIEDQALDKPGSPGDRM
jgi:aminopeptidase N